MGIITIIIKYPTMDSTYKRAKAPDREVTAIVTRASKLPRNAARYWWLMTSHLMCLRSKASWVREERFWSRSLSTAKMPSKKLTP